MTSPGSDSTSTTTTSTATGSTSTPKSTAGGRSRSDPRATPAMRQYARFKKQFPECVLFFRMGDFYEMFDDDAVLAHKVLGITLTERTEGVPMAGVPYHAVETYLQRMIAQGYRVALCEQVQDPAEAKGVVDRAVTRVLTPGTLIDENLLEEGAANTIAAVQFTEVGDNAAAVIASAELSTGELTVQAAAFDELVDELARLDPTELLYVETADREPPPRVKHLQQALGCALTARPAWSFRQTDARELLLQHFQVSTLQGFGLDEDDPAIGPCGGLVRYLQETQHPDAEAGCQPLAHLQPPRKIEPQQSMRLDLATLRSLEIERTMRTGGTDGSLMAVFRHCCTSMGKRLLRQWLCFPLLDRSVIRQRQDVVEGLVEDRDRCRALQAQLDQMHDVARISSRIAVNRAAPRDIVALGKSAQRLSELIELLAGAPPLDHYRAALLELDETLTPLAEMIIERCVDHPPPHMREGGLFRDGVDAELDEARSLQNDANAWLAAYQKRLIEQTSIPSLKVGYNKVFGYYIEVTHAHTAKVPDDFRRKQTLKNAERYITSDLKEFEDKVTTAETRAIERERALFERLCRTISNHVQQLSRFAELVAELDVLQCFAETAARNQYVKPTLVDEPVLDIREGRHPVLDQPGYGNPDEQFVPNDCKLGNIDQSTLNETSDDNDANDDTANIDTADTSGSLALITGPNMAGKSTYIRQVALITLLAHTGSFVPAKRATIGLTDRIFTRIGASDELHAGQSTFMVEMVETANILHHATQRSLVILDEIGRGTSTLDGLSLAWAIAEALADAGCRTLFATHYHELTALADRFEQVSNLHVAVREWGEQIIFLYRILPGRTDRSYGIHVAKIAGLPDVVVRRARQLLESLAVQTEQPAIPGAADTPAATAPSTAQMSLFTEYVDHPAIKSLREIDLQDLSPMQAFDLLRDLRQQVDEK